MSSSCGYSDPIPVSAFGGPGDLTISLYLASGATAAPRAPQQAAIAFSATGDQTAETAGGRAGRPGSRSRPR
ncbi:hypothetical protein GCM10009838_00700 [Catenulispora subtropica]|uniref:Uncharacterized protein n=1 Tax=Catenulispora subtropica TaxID=450798 RepID=A0ABN2QDG8_9ACTN